MKELLLIPVYFIMYIFYTLFSVFGLIGKIISNLFEKKCNKDINDIVAIDYFSIELPDLVWFLLYYDENKIPSYINRSKADTLLSKEDFCFLTKSIKKNNLLKRKKYIINNPFMFFWTYFIECTACDGGAGRQDLTIYFKDGTFKEITGYSKEMENLRRDFEKIVPKEKFY